MREEASDGDRGAKVLGARIGVHKLKRVEKEKKKKRKKKTDRRGGHGLRAGSCEKTSFARRLYYKACSVQVRLWARVEKLRFTNAFPAY